MTAIGISQSMVRGGIPYLHRSIIACRGDMGTVMRPRYSLHLLGMTKIGEQKLSCNSIPDLHRRISACRGNTCSIVGPYYGPDLGRMTAIGIDVMAQESIPDLHSLV